MAIRLPLYVDGIEDMNKDFLRIVNLASSIGLTLEINIEGVIVFITGTENKLRLYNAWKRAKEINSPFADYEHEPIP